MDGHSSRIVIGASAAALALMLAACGGGSDDATSATTVPTPTTPTPTTAAPSGLKTIDPAAVQELVDATMRDLGVPGAVVLLRTPQGEVTATLRHDGARH
jgi:D-alanyl-D-alanine carboxypeptidase